MEFDPPPGVYAGKVRLKPTELTKWLVLPVALVVWRAFNGPVALAPILVVAILIIIDAFVSMRAVQRCSFEPELHTTVAMPPERITVDLHVTNGPAMLLAPGEFSLTDQLSHEDTIRVDAGIPVVRVMAPIGHTTAKKYFRWVMSHSSLGFITAYRGDTAILDTVLSRGPDVAERTALIEGIDEIGRIREYTTGDRWSRVSWPTTARLGELHVRDSAPSDQADTVVVIDLGTIEEFAAAGRDFHDLTVALSYAAAIGLELLDAGVSIRLISSEPPESFFALERATLVVDPKVIASREISAHEHIGQMHDEFVSDRDELIRRLSLADVGPVSPPAGPHIRISLDGIEIVS